MPTAMRSHVTFMVAQVLGFWPEYEFVKQLYASGKYGKLLSGTMTRLGNIPGWSWDSWMAMYEFDGFTIHSEAAWYAPQGYRFNVGFRFQFEKAVVVSGADVLVVYEKDGGHGMIFRTREGKLLLSLHSPNQTPEERPHFFEIAEEDGLLRRV